MKMNNELNLKADVRGRAGDRSLTISLDNVMIGASDDDEVVGVTAISLDNFIRSYREYYGDIDKVVFEVNSGGGSLLQGLEMYEMIKGMKEKTVGRVMGFCGSAATCLLLACDESYISPSGMYMIHEPYATIGGKCAEMESGLATCWKLRDKLVGLYVDAMKISADEVEKALAVETYYVGQEAVDAGLVLALWGADDPDMRAAACALRDGTAEQKKGWHKSILAKMGLMRNAAPKDVLNDLQKELYSKKIVMDKTLEELKAERAKLDEDIKAHEAVKAEEASKVAEMAAKMALDMLKADGVKPQELPPPVDDVPQADAVATAKANGAAVYSKSDWEAKSYAERVAIMSQGAVVVQ